MRVKRCYHHPFTVSNMDDLFGCRDLVGLKVLQDVVRKNLPAYGRFVARAMYALDPDDISVERLELIP